MYGKQMEAPETQRSQDSAPPRTELLDQVRRWREAEVPRLALWTPAAIGLGVAAAFAQPADPSTAALVLVAAAALAAGLAAASASLRAGGWMRAALRVFCIALTLGAVGFLSAERRIWSVEAPVWPTSVWGERGVSGRLIAVSRTASGAPRLRLDRLEIEGLEPSQTPERAEIRLTERELEGAALLSLVGRRLGLRTRLFPPPSAAEPKAFDFRFRAYFQQVGALGVQGEATAAALRDLGPGRVAGPVDRFALAVARQRAAIAARARAAAPGVEGAMIAALLVGDRSGLPEQQVTALRDANLAHLLAISGLHMAMVCLTVFAALRLLLAAPLRPLFGVSAKKTAAVGAILAGAAYLQLSGGGAPSERAFAMIAAAFGAVLVDRPAVTLRAVALAATILLLLRPESLFDAGFQLSFAATTAMVAVFEASRSVWRRERRQSWRRSLALWFGALVVSSMTAGLATAPFAALAFNRLSRWGLFANLLAVPAMGLWIMPLGVAALALTPLGLDAPVYALMALGITYVLSIAEAAAGLPGARIHVGAAPEICGGLIALAGLSLCLWRGPALKALGLAPLVLALTLWSSAERPDLLIARSGRLLGVLDEQGRGFDRDPRRVESYSAELWLRRDGDRADLDEAAARRVFEGRRGVRSAPLPHGWRVVRISRRGLEWTDLAKHCAPNTLLIAPQTDVTTPGDPIDGAPWRVMPQGCLLLDRTALRAHGAFAIWAPRSSETAPHWLSVAETTPRRAWAP